MRPSRVNAESSFDGNLHHASDGEQVVQWQHFQPGIWSSSRGVQGAEADRSWMEYTRKSEGLV
jgi:hypothetical protein